MFLAVALAALPLSPRPCAAQAAAPPTPAQSVLALREAVVRHDWAEARAILAARRAEADASIVQEGRYVFAYSPFQVPNASLEPHLDAWVAAQPAIAYPRIARAGYRMARAWATRGSAYADKTSSAQMSGMERWAALARADADTALRLDSTDVAAYTARLDVALVAGDDELTAQIVAAGHRFVPASLLFHLKYMQSLRPRWGGSDSSMLEYAARVQRFAPANPRLRALLGFAAYDRAYTLNEHKQKEQALASVTEALSYGDVSSYRLFRARLLLDQDEPERALVDLNRAVALRPGDAVLLGYRAVTYALLGYRNGRRGAVPGLLRRAHADMRDAIALNPYDSEVKWAGRYFAELTT